MKMTEEGKCGTNIGDGVRAGEQPMNKLTTATKMSKCREIRTELLTAPISGEKTCESSLKSLKAWLNYLILSK